MRIGYDAKRAFTNLSGLGNYARWLIQSFASAYPEHELFLFTPVKNQGVFDTSMYGNIHVITPNQPMHRLSPAWWRTAAVAPLVKRWELDIFHGLSHEVPHGIAKAGCKVAVTIHDLIFMRYPAYYSAIDRLIYKQKIKYAIGQSDLIIAASKQTQTDVQTYFPAITTPIQVMYQDTVLRSFPKYGMHKLIAFGINNPFLLCVGTIEMRKNQLQLLQAFAALNRTDMQIVFAGRQTLYAHSVMKEAERLGIATQVVWIPAATNEQIQMLYQHAHACAYISSFEGFGIPVLEALYHQVPTLVSDTSSLPEVGGNAVLYTHPDNPEQTIRALQMLLTDEALRSNLRLAAQKQVKQFDTPLLMHQLLNMYQNM